MFTIDWVQCTLHTKKTMHTAQMYFASLQIQKKSASEAMLWRCWLLRPIICVFCNNVFCLKHDYYQKEICLLNQKLVLSIYKEIFLWPKTSVTIVKQ